MVTEDYVSFETAKLLKEKGFDEDCYTYWDLTTETKTPKIGLSTSSKNWNYKWNPISFPISAPTLQMAMKWLREKELVICVTPLTFYCGETVKSWGYNIWAGGNLEIDELFNSNKFATYEEACESAIKYCLENLI